LWDADEEADGHLLRILCSPEGSLRREGHGHEGLEQRLLDKGFVRAVDDSVSSAALLRDLRRNPLEHVSEVALEMTTRCNLRCDHCYNATVPDHTERDLEALMETTDLFCSLGVKHFMFIGGEVTKYGDGWLSVARNLSGRGAEVVGVMTNGWWLGQRDFEAAGRVYPTSWRYLTDLREHGVTHVVFSLDGPAAEHDANRHSPGLYKRILVGIGQVRAAGLVPRFSLLVRNDGGNVDFGWLAGLARRLYPEARDLDDTLASALLGIDPTNVVTNFVDYGSAARARGPSGVPLAEISPRWLRCAGFYRPAPQLTVKASGEIATCRLGTAGEGYGNIHEAKAADILNHLHERFVYRLHADRLIGRYLEFVDPDVFGDRFASICTLRAIVTLIARTMEAEGVDPTGLDPEDRRQVARINREVAVLTGHQRVGCSS